MGLFGGAERYALELAKGMAHFTSTRLVAFGTSSRARQLDGVQVRVERERWRVAGRAHDPINIGFLRHCLWADVIHCHQFRSTSCALATVVGRLTSKGVYVTDHGGGGSNLIRRLRIGRWFDAQLSQSEFAAASMPYVGRRKEIIYAGVDADRYRPVAEKIRSRVLFLGRLLPHKGIEHLIRGLPEGAELKIVGRAIDTSYLRFLKEAAQGINVEFVNSAGDDEVIAQLSSAQCLVLPSVYEDYQGRRRELPELVGLVLLEAMACGTAVVCSDAGGMPEIVLEGKTGFVVIPGSADELRTAISRLIGDPELAGQMGRSAREDVVNRFTWKKVARHCLDLY